MRIAICDDDPASQGKIQSVLAARSELQLEISCYDSGEELLEASFDDCARFDALFIDMEMAEMNGIHTASAIRAMDEDVVIVFVTSHNKYMKESFQCRALRYVDKAQLDSELGEAIDAVAAECRRKRQSITFVDNKASVHLYYDEIYYIESNGHYLEFHTKTGVYRSRSTMAEFEKNLTPGTFARLHKGFLVNLENVCACDAKAVTLRGGAVTALPLGEKYKDAFRAAWHHYLERKAGL